MSRGRHLAPARSTPRPRLELPARIEDPEVAARAYVVDALHTIRCQLAVLSDPERLAAAPLPEVLAAYAALCERTAPLLAFIHQAEGILEEGPR